MNNHRLLLEIDINNFIQIAMPCEVEKLVDCDEVIVDFHSSGEVYTILNGEFIGVVFENLEEALAKTPILNSSLQQDSKDFGCKWNEFKYKIMTNKNNENLSGNAHTTPLWSWMAVGLSAWLFLKDGHYYFEDTLDFQWDLEVEERTPEEVAAFHKFLATYKPIATVEVPNEKILEWKKQCVEGLRYTDLNVERTFYPVSQAAALRRRSSCPQAVQTWG